MGTQPPQGPPPPPPPAPPAATAPQPPAPEPAPAPAAPAAATPRKPITLTQIGAGVAAIVGVLASLVGVLSYIDDKRAPPPPEASKSLQIDSVDLLDRAEPLGDFLYKNVVKGGSYTAQERRRRGYSFKIVFSSEGAVGRRLRLRWRLHADGAGPVPGPDYGQTASDFKAVSPRHRTSVPAWVPYPIEPGTYFVRFTFERLDDGGGRLAYGDEMDSERFDHLPAP